MRLTPLSAHTATSTLRIERHPGRSSATHYCSLECAHNFPRFPLSCRAQLALKRTELEALQRSLEEAGRAAREADKRCEALGRQLEEAKERVRAAREAADRREAEGKRRAACHLCCGLGNDKGGYPSCVAMQLRGQVAY